MDCVQWLQRPHACRCQERTQNFAFIQAEDEARRDRHGDRCIVNGAAGRSRHLRSLASRSWNEFLGLAYYAEVPAVIFDIQRVGPSTGMPPARSQGDIMACALRLAR